MTTLIRQAAELQQLIEAGQPANTCQCGIGACRSWESLAEERWPSRQMVEIASLRDPAIEDPTFEEVHPQGTRYDSKDAPIVPGFFPYNRCDVWRCQGCNRHLLRYTEFGGYYVDHRVREIAPTTPILDAPKG